MTPAKIVHLITGLEAGGTETMLYKLLTATDRARFSPEVVSLLRGGAMVERIQRLGIEVHTLGMRRGVPNPGALARLVRLLRRHRPELLQTWLMHSDLLGGIAAVLTGVPVVWNIRHSALDPASRSRLTGITERTCAALSGWVPRMVICCSTASKDRATELGFRTSKLRVIPNGFDLSAFRPDPGARASVRGELGLAPETALVGLVARFDPNKDHRTFLSAAGRLHAVRPEVHFLLCGREIVPENPALSGAVRAERFEGVVHLLGPRSDIPRLQAALDVACSSSVGEGFPNVIGEAMACGVPCVVTDAGDSAEIVGDTGRVVGPRDPEALAAALRELLDMGEVARRGLGLRARARVSQLYRLEVVARDYEELYDRIIAGAA